MYATISLDLNNISSQDRASFYKYLKEQGWEKYHNLTTTWKISYNGNSEDNIIADIQKDIENGTSLIRISSYEVLVSLSINEPIEFSS